MGAATPPFWFIVPLSTTTPLMDFDTDFWSEIQDAPGEIFDIPELRDEDEDEQTWNEFVNSNVTL
jgi:hypothetical protein